MFIHVILPRSTCVCFFSIKMNMRDVRFSEFLRERETLPVANF